MIADLWVVYAGLLFGFAETGCSLFSGYGLFAVVIQMCLACWIELLF